jgi:hypothetical protein
MRDYWNRRRLPRDAIGDSIMEMPEDQTNPVLDQPVLVLVRDLMFSSKIRATAQAAAVPIKLLRDPSALAGEGGSKLIVDLTLPNAIEIASIWKARTGGGVIGFIGHTDVETIARAQAAGLDQVLTRGQFTQMLSSLLSTAGNSTRRA